MVDVLNVHVIQLEDPVQFGDQFAQSLRNFGVVQWLFETGEDAAAADRTQMVLLGRVVVDRRHYS